MSKIFLQERKWLNPVGSYDTGWYSVDVSKDDVSFDIADCSRKLSLNFYFENKKEYNQKMKKLDMLRGALDRMASAMSERLESL